MLKGDGRGARERERGQSEKTSQEKQRMRPQSHRFHSIISSFSSPSLSEKILLLFEAGPLSMLSRFRALRPPYRSRALLKNRDTSVSTSFPVVWNRSAADAEKRKLQTLLSLAGPMEELMFYRGGSGSSGAFLL